MNKDVGEGIGCLLMAIALAVIVFTIVGCEYLEHKIYNKEPIANPTKGKEDES